MYSLKHKSGLYLVRSGWDILLTDDIDKSYKLKTISGAKLSKTRLGGSFTVKISKNVDVDSLSQDSKDILLKCLYSSKATKKTFISKDKYFSSKETDFTIVDVDKEGLASLGDGDEDKLYVARESGEEGLLCLFRKMPVKNEDGSFSVSEDSILAGNVIYLPDNLFPDVTYENSPKLVKMLVK